MTRRPLVRKPDGARRRKWAGLAGGLAAVAVALFAGHPSAAAPDIVLYASDVTTVQGNWTKASSSSAAGGQYMSSADNGWALNDAASASPANYFEAPLTATAGTPYHVWVRLRAGSDSKWNDSAWVQFSDATDQNGSAAYRSGTSNALLVNLENCSGCGVSGWGWQDRSWWLAQSPIVMFPTTGTHTVRVQTREDGVQIDQIVLSPATYFSSSPGQVTGDNTIVPKASGGSTSVASVSSVSTVSASGSTPLGGTPWAIPGTIQAEDFDDGGEGVAYHDSTSGNSGGAYRSTDVDIESASEGGSDVGWTSAGEWLNYTVNVASSGSYTATVRVASSGQGGTFHIEMNGVNVSGTLTIPNSGGWQNWVNVSATVTLAAGRQVSRLVFDGNGSSGAVGNVNFMQFTAASSGSGSTTSSSTSTTTTTSASSGPLGGTPWALPGTVQAEDFDNGGEGVAYHDTTSGNAGGAYRQTDVDIESSSEGGSDVGWTAAGEWLNYTVKVATAGTYTVQLRVASPNGGTVHVGFNGPSSVWTAASVPNTGGWQTWTTISLTASLGAGQQVMTVYFDTGGLNLNYMVVSGGTTSVSSTQSTSSSSTSSTSSSTDITVVDWNVQVDDPSAAHAQAVIDYMMSMSPQPQIIVVEEAHQSQYNTYLSELQAQTGRTWTGVMKTHCPLGSWNGSSCTGSEDEGVGIFTLLPMQNSSSTYLPYADAYHSARAAVRAAITVNGTTLQVFGIHLQPNNATARYNSMSVIRNWTPNYSKPQIMGGDFNADPDQIDTSAGLLGAFVDASVQVGSTGFSAFMPAPTMKIDYWFSDPGGKAVPQWVVIDGNSGSRSDHLPIISSFRIYQ